MKDAILAEEEKPNDCDLLIDKLENTFDEFENCFDALTDDKKTKMNVVGSIFSFGLSLTKLTLNVAGCAIKNTPKAVVAVASIKRDVIYVADGALYELERGYNQLTKEMQEDALNEKIKQLTLKNRE